MPAPLNPPHGVSGDPAELIGLFYASTGELGQFEQVLPGDMPEPYARLLAHEHHMTVTVESFHGSPVDVQVLRLETDGTHYSREILLTRQSDGRVVQYGIMRINLSFLGPEVRREVQNQGTPLGRILIQHNVLRRVHLRSLYRVHAGHRLAELLALEGDTPIYGRTALIECNGEPAVELLEIVAAES